ncbi:MAG: transporter substrate-binding domain-containing protein [Dorea sp.]
MKRKLIAALLCMTMVGTMLIGCGKEEASDDSATGETTSEVSEDEIEGSMEGVTLKVGTSGLFGPFSYYDEDGTTLIGYDLDLIQDLQDILGFEIDGGIQAMDYSALTTSLAEGKLDMGAAALCATDERKEVMNFTDIYCDSGQVVMVNSEDDKGITGVDDLAGKVVAVEKGTASHTYATKNLTDSTLEVHDTITTAYESLEQGKVDAVLQDGPGAAFYIKTTDGTKLKVVGDEFNQGQAPYCVAVSKDCEYYEQINAAVKMLIEDGTTDELYSKWCE